MKKLKILLIPGHGAGDPGACGHGYKEAELTRDAVTLLEKKLSNVADITVFDFNKNMFEYLKSGKTYPFKNFDYVIEVHFNAWDGTAKGTEVLVHKTEKGVSVEQAIVDNIAALGFANRGVKPRSDLRVMNTVKNKYGVSHALIEICFIDNKADIQRYISNKTKVIDAIANGVIKGFGIEAPTEKAKLTTANDIIWELSQHIQIDDVEGAVAALEKAKKENNPLYWLLYKVVNK